jgi:hypothetical protein
MFYFQDILVLQEVYSHFMTLYQMVLVEFADIVPFVKSSNLAPMETSKEKLEQILFFILECLSNLVVGKGSVLSIWALDPSVFIVLTRHSGLLTRTFSARYPWIHQALVATLRTHCSSHGYFLSSSQLISGSGSTTSAISPTSEYFRMLLETMTAMLDQVS